MPEVRVLCEHVKHDGKRCEVGEVIEVSQKDAYMMTSSGYAESTEEQGFEVLGQQPLIDDPEDDEPEDEKPEAKAKAKAKGKGKKAK